MIIYLNGYGKNKDWSANHVQHLDVDKNIPFNKSLVYYLGFKLKIQKDKNKNTKICIEIKDFIGQEKTIVFPDNSGPYNIDTWELLIIN